MKAFFTKKFLPIKFDLVMVFLKYFYPNLQCDLFDRSSLFSMQYIKIFLLVYSVFIIQKVYDVMNEYV